MASAQAASRLSFADLKYGSMFGHPAKVNHLPPVDSPVYTGPTDGSGLRRVVVFSRHQSLLRLQI